MPATDYPELQGLPTGCTQTDPLGFDAIPVSVPYQGVDEAVVMQDPLTVNMTPQQLDIFHNEDVILNLDVPGQSIGYQTEIEMQVLNGLKQEASALENNTAFYHPDAKEAIVDLAARAKELLLENYQIYEEFEQERYASKQGGFVAFPLSVQDDYVEDQVQPSPSYPSSMQARTDARDQIRENYLEAIYVIWCAMYGANQSLSWRENRNAYMEAHPTQEGGGLGVPVPPKPTDGIIPPPKPPLPKRAPKTQPPPLPGDLGPWPPDGSGPGPGPGPGDFPPDGFPPDYQPPPPSGKRRSSGGGAAMLIGGIVVVGLLASKK